MQPGKEPDAEIVLVHPLVPRLKPVPVTVTEGADRSPPLLLVSVTVFGRLGTPAGCLPKFIFLGDSPTGGFVADGIDCAIARPPSMQSKAQSAIAAILARRAETPRPPIHDSLPYASRILPRPLAVR